MTVEPLFLQSTSTIASPSNFWPAEIEVVHHQLRNFISTAYRDKIFYANRFDICVIDLITRQRSILATVPVDARCLTADHGWICVGGEAKGECAFVYVGEDEHGDPGTTCHELIVRTVGNEIVNSMTVQMLKPKTEEHKGEVVVLVSNNDRTVTIFSLSQRAILATIEHPKSMNCAVLSPDSTILVAVGDENKVYFLKRILEDTESDPAPTTPYYPNYNWRPLATPDVPRGTQQPEDFSFAATFSPDGRLCAVASQGGAITVFDMEVIEAELSPAEDAILCSFRSSRPSLWGCVRAMAFSPGNWDVLAWAEDHGRVGVADVRQGFHRRQHMDLDKKAFHKVELTDTTPAEWKGLNVKDRMSRQHQQRTQLLRGHPPVGARSHSDSVPRVQESTSPETSASAGLETNTDNTENPRRPYSINYSADQPRLQASASFGSSLQRREYDVQLLNPGPRQRNTHGPRRRASVVLSQPQSSQHLVPDENSRVTMTASPGPISDDGLPPPMSTNDLTPSAGSTSSQPLPYNIPPSDPWHVIESSLVNSRLQQDGASRTSNGLSQIEHALSAERQLASRLERQLDDERRLSALLRSELDVRERHNEIRRREQYLGEQGDDPLTPSLDRVLRQHLHSERDHGQRRAEELEREIRNMSRRVSQLMEERDVLSRQRIARPPAAENATRSPATLTVHTLHENHELRDRLQRMEQDRIQRAQRVADLEHEVRRAESRIELASVQTNVEMTRSTLRLLDGDRDDGAMLASRILPILTSNSITNSSSSDARRLLETFENIPSLSQAQRRLRHQRMAVESNLSSNRATVPRTPDLGNRVTDNDLRMARIMMMRNTADANGNWSTAAAQRYFTGFSPTSQNDNGSSLEDIFRESGVGTAGIGWSPDGLRLYAGSVHGVFEFEIQVTDRLQCPLLEMR